MQKFLYPQFRAGLIGYWCPSVDRSRSTLLNDLSGYGNRGTLTNMDPGTDWVASDGKIALDFDGSNDYIDVGNVYPSTTKYTFTAWVKVPVTDGTYTVLSNLSGTGVSVKVVISIGGFALQHHWHGVAFYSSSQIVSYVERWLHCVWSYDGSTTYEYINGQNYGSQTPGTLGTGGNYNIGRRTDGTQYFLGQLDDVCVYRRALSASEINCLYVGGRGAIAATYRVPVVRGASSSGITVTPTTASLVSTTFAPTIPVTVTPSTTTLSLTTYAPVVGTAVVPTTASLVSTSFAPTLDLTVTPTTANVVLTTYAPVVSTTVTPSTTSLVLTSFVPTVGLAVVPSTAALTLTSFAPNVPVAVTPSTANLSLTTYAPNLNQSVTVIPETASLSLSSFAPSVPVVVTPTTRSVVLTTYAPIFDQSITVIPATASLALTSFAPSIPVTVTPVTRVVVVSTFTPVLSTAVTPTATTLSITTLPPEIVTPVTIIPGTHALVLTEYPPSLGDDTSSLILQYYLYIQ